MRRRIPVRVGLVFSLLLLGSLAFSSPLFAQVRIPAAALADATGVQELLQEGIVLEQQRRWGEALTLYERGIKDYPDQSDLEQRLTLARIHYDLGRRYGDASFTTALHKMDEREALDLYSEVLLKIQAYYVNTPNWNDLVGRGTANLRVALGDPAFVNHHLRGVSADRITAARRELDRTMAERVARNRHDAHDLAALASRVVAQQLGIAAQVFVQEYTCGATNALDPYSSYLTNAQYSDVMSQIDGNFVGLGIELRAENDALAIVSVISGGPAGEAGIGGGDRIVEVNHRTTKDLTTDTAADMLKGEEGTTVDVKVITPDDVVRHLRLRRERVEIPSVENVAIIDRDFGIGYIQLTAFQKTTLRDFNAAMWQLHRDGMKSLIVDVRGNPGGLLEASVDIADKFVSQGTIVATRGRNPREDYDHKARSYGTWRTPLIVLVDNDSASASEIFAGAIRDHRRGTIVGERSYGKGSVQGIFPLNGSRAGIRLTTAKFYSPNGHPISGRGVSPDVAVRTVAKPVDGGANVTDSEDVILNSALQLSRRQLSRRE